MNLHSIRIWVVLLFTLTAFSSNALEVQEASRISFLTNTPTFSFNVLEVQEASRISSLTNTPAFSSNALKVQEQKSEQITEKKDNYTNMEEQKSLYDFIVKDIDGNDFDLATLKGKKVLIVNVASKCGFTPQYKQLQELYEEYNHLNFVVIGFPANNFLGQEPGSNEEIKEFCTANYGVTFPMMEKISVKGKNQAPLYQWLTKKSENGVMDQKVTWNFQKFMVDENGYLVGVAMPKESPMSDRIVNWITGK